MTRAISISWAVLGVLGSPFSRADAPPESRESPRQNASPYIVDFNRPPRAYVITNAQGWAVWMESELVRDHPALATNALRRLDQNLAKLTTVLPSHTLPLLRNCKIFLMLGEQSTLGGRNSGADYFQRHAPQHFPQLDPRMGGSVLIYSAKNYVWLSDLWALKVLMHELAHAWHLEQWPEKEPAILAAHRNAAHQGLYREVLTDEGDLHPQAYALNNQLEYFAELSCMYFVECNYPPRRRGELRDYDPIGHDMIRRMWKLEPSTTGGNLLENFNPVGNGARHESQTLHRAAGLAGQTQDQ